MSRKKIGVMSILLLALVIASFFVYRQFFKPKGTADKEKSIAILPFKEIGANTDNISEGLVEDILVHLSKISELSKVISNRSSSQYANSTKTIAEIGDELQVNSLVMGSIQQIGDTIRVSAQLIDSRTGNTLWADNYTMEKRRIFDLETELATRIVDALQAKLTPREEKGLSKRYTENVDAYRFYVKGRAYWAAAGRENFDSAEANYKRAIELEPDYALAYAGLADCHVINFKGLSPFDEVPIAKSYLEKALSLDSTLSEALATLGFIQQNFDFDWSQARKNLEKAVDIDPNNSVAHSYYGLVLMHSTPDKEGALREFKKAVELDPVSNVTNWILGRNYYFAGKYDLAVNQFKKTAPFSNKAQQYIATWSLGLIYLKQHRYKEAKDAFDQLPEGNVSQLDNYQIMQAYGYAVMGDKIKAQTLLDETIRKYTNLSHYRNAQVYVALGNFEEAMNQLELGYAVRDLHMFWINVDPAFDPIRNEPPLQSVVEKDEPGIIHPPMRGLIDCSLKPMR